MSNSCDSRCQLVANEIYTCALPEIAALLRLEVCNFAHSECSLGAYTNPTQPLLVSPALDGINYKTWGRALCLADYAGRAMRQNSTLRWSSISPVSRIWTNPASGYSRSFWSA